jgi:uncharacterized membrane protein
LILVRRPKLRLLLILAILAGVGFLLAGPLRDPSCTLLGAAQKGLLRVPVANLPAGTARFFCYRDDAGRRLRFVLARDSEGHVHAVMDACRQCYKFHKGYLVTHGHLICRLCGTRYKLKSMDTGKASCVPVPLQFQTRGDTVQIKVSDLKARRWLF